MEGGEQGNHDEERESMRTRKGRNKGDDEGGRTKAR